MSEDAATFRGRLSPDGQWVWDGARWQPASARLRPSTPAWLRTSLNERPRSWMLVPMALAAVLTDQVLRTAAFGTGAAVLLVTGAVALVAAGLTRREPRVLAAAAVVFAGWTAVRSSPWLAWPDLAASIGLLLVAASLRWQGSLLDLGVAEAGARTAYGLLHVVLGTKVATSAIRRTWPRVGPPWPVLRGAALAAPIAALVGWLLASADPVFASFFQFQVDPAQLGLDAMFLMAGTVVMGGLLRVALAKPLPRVEGPERRFGLIEALLVIGVLDLLFAAFAIAQLVAVSAAGEQTLRAAGVTYAEYARSGFFQLLYVAAITLVVLVTAIRTTALDQRGRFIFQVACGVATVLAILVVYVAFRRLQLYEVAYGFTMLRLYSHVFAVWIGVVFVVLAIDLAVVSRRRWFTGAAVTTFLVTLLLLNVANPEALIVKLDTSRAETSRAVDSAYLASLSDDAVPTLAATQPQVPPDLAPEIRRAMCAAGRHAPTGWVGWTLAEWTAAAARNANHC